MSCVMNEQNPIERAFQLADSGKFRSVNDIRRQLKREGFMAIDSHLDGLGLKRQLRQRMAVALDKRHTPNRADH